MKPRILVSVFLLSVFFLGACSSPEAGLKPSDVTFDVSLIEIKGSTTTDKLEAPDVDPHSQSLGYGYAAPGDFDSANPASWQVSTYLFSPSALTAVKGDTITLRLFVVNGNAHTVWLEAPDGTKVQEVTMNRGREYTMGFTADQAGYYTLLCETHGPTMQAKILVLP